MSRLNWGPVGERYYETGVDRGVLYIDSDVGVPWSGLISVTESPEGGEARPYYLDGIKYFNRAASEEYVATIQAFFSPKEFDACDGSIVIYAGLFATHQRRKSFGFSYRTKLGNDVDGVDHGYKIHIVYNALASPAEHANSTINEAIDPSTLSWAITTTPPLMTGYKPTAHLVIDSRTTPEELLVRLEDLLYGSDIELSRLLSLSEIMALYGEYVLFKITIIGVGEYRAEGSAVEIVTPGVFTMDHESITDNLDGSFTIIY